MNRRLCGRCKREVATPADVDAWEAADPKVAREIGKDLCWGPGGAICVAFSEGKDPALSRRRR